MKRVAFIFSSAPHGSAAGTLVLANVVGTFEDNEEIEVGGTSRALAAGRWVAGVAAYELGYAFEPRLAPLLPRGRRLPLLAFGIFGPPGPACPAAPGGTLGGFVPAWDEAAYGAAFTRVAAYIRAGDIYQAKSRAAEAGDKAGWHGHRRQFFGH